MADPLEDTIAELDHTFAHHATDAEQWAGTGERYEFGARIGVGGQGEVLRVRDTILGREIAMKVLRETPEDDLELGGFVREARLMAEIGHPNIMPIFDAGVLPDGRFFYTMPLLAHRTLAELIEQIEMGEDVPLVRLMRLFANACGAVHTAHLKGVIHRDLKPHNMVIGPSGELLVTDFGLALRLDAPRVSQPDGPSTPAGPIGTPLYMSPEQARGEAAGPASDIYSLGAMLYELLTLRRPIEADTIVTQLVAILNEVPADAHTIDTRRKVPLDLSLLATRCLSKDPSLRPQTASELVEVIEGWLEGRFEDERQREECAKRVAHAQEKIASAGALSQAIHALQTSLRARWAETAEHEPVEVKETLWEMEGNIVRLEVERDEAEDAAIGALDLALRAQPEDVAARKLWVDVHLGRRERLMSAGHAALARRAAARAIRVGGEMLEHRLYGSGRLWVQSDMPLTLERYAIRKGILAPGDPVRMQTQIDVPPGSYRVRAEVAGMPTYLPLDIVADATLAVGFHPGLQAGLPAGFALVHAGPALLGGDDDASYSEPVRQVDMHGFGLARHPVNAGEYLEWLRSFADPEQALLHSPRATADGGPYWKIAGGHVVIPMEDGDGDAWDPTFPVFAITCRDAEAYIVWRSARDGRSYRLPTDEEWERAARGADGRRYPWGDRFDPALCKMRLSRPGQFRPEPIGTFATDVSPFGIIDMAGGVAEWTSSAYRDDPHHRCVKGGAWSSRAHRCAASFRGSMIEDHVSADLGFRLAIGL